MERPEEVTLSRQDGEALIERLRSDTLTAQDPRVLEQVLRWYFWLLFALQEARFSLKRLRAIVFGDRAKKRPQAPSSGGVAGSGGGAGEQGAAPAEAPGAQADRISTQPSSGARRAGTARRPRVAVGGAVCAGEVAVLGLWPSVHGRGAGRGRR
jgi:hypothetical protein